MDTATSPAEELPALYRSILDGVLQLEQLGERREALLVRAAASRAYSSSWDERSRRKLLGIRRRIDRVVVGQTPARQSRPRYWLPLLRALSPER